MTTLEDKILKKNIPGKYTWWESDECENPHSDDSYEEAEKVCDSSGPKIDVHKGRANTGVKGVIADYKSHRKKQIANEEIEKQINDGVLRDILYGKICKNETSNTLQKSLKNDGSDDEYESESEEAMMRYRSQRILEIQKQFPDEIFGEVTEATDENFIEEVDGVNPKSFVVVHLHEPYLRSCQRLNSIFETLAKEKPHTKFIKMLSSYAGGEEGYDPVALPTLTVYKNKNVVLCLTRITEIIGEEFTKSDVESLLRSNNIL
mmetsp:Transcript_17052/g.25213  ORF Transcript_17052/g.25213 Transcript_17052/m.25213 type:complete len:262 (-) Transcript_17052:29-814(-)